MLDLDEANSRRGPQVATNLNRANKDKNQFATKKTVIRPTDFMGNNWKIRRKKN